MYKPIASLFCSHLWNEVEPDTKGVKDTSVMITWCEVECAKCGKRTRMTRKDYINHAVKTRRIVS